MAAANDSSDLTSEMEVDAFRRAVASADGSALAKIGSTTMLAAIKMEVMTPVVECPDEGSIAIEFPMPPICSPLVRPGRPADVASVISKQLSDTIVSSGMIDLKELCLVGGKAAWMVNIPVVSLNDDGQIVLVSEDTVQLKLEKEPVNKEKRKLKLNSPPFSLTCILNKNYILADPTAEEESIMETVVTVVLDSSYQLVSLYKPGGPVLGHTSGIQVSLHHNINAYLNEQQGLRRAKELQNVLNEAISDMEIFLPP
ncbi:protection of telomeres 1 protein [Capsicum annuum]|nr:protection of telomeres 1 protein [Capsicum annuum]